MSLVGYFHPLLVKILPSPSSLILLFGFQKSSWWEAEESGRKTRGDNQRGLKVKFVLSTCSEEVETAEICFLKKDKF